MKKIWCFLSCCLSIVLVSCDGNSPVMKKVVTGDATDITDSSARLNGTLNVDPDGYASFYCGILIAQTQEEIKKQKGKFYQSTAINDKAFHVNVYGLKPNTHYYYSTWNGYSRRRGAPKYELCTQTIFCKFETSSVFLSRKLAVSTQCYYLAFC